MTQFLSERPAAAPRRTRRPGRRHSLDAGPLCFPAWPQIARSWLCTEPGRTAWMPRRSPRPPLPRRHGRGAQHWTGRRACGGPRSRAGLRQHTPRLGQPCPLPTGEAHLASDLPRRRAKAKVTRGYPSARSLRQKSATAEPLRAPSREGGQGGLRLWLFTLFLPLGQGFESWAQSRW